MPIDNDTIQTDTQTQTQTQTAAQMPVKEAAPMSTFTVAELMAQATILDTTPDIIAGALYGVTDAITKEDAAAKIQDYLSRPIK